MWSDSNCLQESLVLGREVEGDRWEHGGDALELVDLVRGCAHMILGNLDEGLGRTDDEGIRLSVCSLVIVAKNYLKTLGSPRSASEVMSSTTVPLSMRIEADRRRCSLCWRSVLGANPCFRRIRPLVEGVQLGPHCEIGFRVLSEALGELAPLGA